MSARLYTDPLTGKSLTAKEWAKKLGIPLQHFRNRLNRWKGDQFAPSEKKERNTYTNPATGECFTDIEWAKKLGITLKGFKNRVTTGQTKNRFIPAVQLKDNKMIKTTNPATGESLTDSEWAKRLGITPNGFTTRRINGKPENLFAPATRSEKIPIQYTDPLTGRSQTAKEWAAELGITVKAFRNRLLRWEPAHVFSVAAAKERLARKLYTNPVTQERHSLARWAEILSISETALYHRFCKWGEDNPKTYDTTRLINRREPEEGKETLLHIIRKRQGVHFCNNPITGESLLASEWAEYYRVPIHKFYQEAKRLGKDSRELHILLGSKRRELMSA